ncbi:UNVERIFIED_CONTAM: hypothetical protein GTU68_044907, partial [Idotea baltica]|nr:hypothetical protein [Idotea baltica]
SLAPGINAQTTRLFQQLLIDSPNCGVALHNIAGATVAQFASDATGTIEAGRLLAKICLGGDGQIDVVGATEGQVNLQHVSVAVNNPLVSCMGCQYAGWPLSTENYFAMCSGPIRLLRGQEPVLKSYHLLQTDEFAIGVLEASRLPDETTIKTVCDATGVQANNLTLCVAPTSSLPGSTQVVARSVETAMHKLHELGFDLRQICRGSGSAPLPPQTGDDLIALGWTNDSILYGSSVRLVVDTKDVAIESILNQVPSCSSREFGVPFLELFKRYDMDFYKIDKMLFSPAKITFENLRTGNSFSTGQVRNDLLIQSFGI